MKKLPDVLIFLLVVIFAISGCSESNLNKKVTNSTQIQVVASIFPIADIVRNIGGDKVAVTTLIPAGSSPHTFEATPEQIKQLSDSLLFVKVGAGLDSFADKLVSSGSTQTATLTLADKVSLLHEEIEASALEEPAAEKHQHDKNPHFWLDPVLVKEVLAPEITQALSAISPDNKQFFEANLNKYCNQLDELDREISSKTSSLKSKSFIAFHSSWGYFCERYELDDITVEEFPGKEPSAKWIANIIDLARQKKAGAVLIEPQFSPKAAKVLAGEIGIPVITVDPLGAETIPGYDSYIDLMRTNVDNIVKAYRR